MILIFANGDLPSTNWIKPYLDQAAVIIAADGGMRHLQALNHRPDFLIGDLDSLPSGALAELETAGVELVSYPRAKDETDLELALLYAVEHFDGPVYVFAAAGGRLDQTVGNVLLLAHTALAGREVKLLSEHQRAWLVRDHTTITGEPGDRVSLLPIGGAVEIAHTAGLQWSLENENLTFGPARGLSNVMTAAEATVILNSGWLLCVHTAGAWKR